MKILKLILTIALIAAGCTKQEDNTSLNSSDKFFFQQAGYANLAEINEGGIAVTNADSDFVKSFGQMMITDHGTQQAELGSLAGSLQVQLPTTPDSAHQAMATQLQSLHGYVFDTTYINAQVRDHMYTISVCKDEITYGNNLQLKDYAGKYLPVMQMHLQEAQNIQAMLH